MTLKLLIFLVIFALFSFGSTNAEKKFESFDFSFIQPTGYLEKSQKCFYVKVSYKPLRHYDYNARYWSHASDVISNSTLPEIHQEEDEDTEFLDALEKEVTQKTRQLGYIHQFFQRFFGKDSDLIRENYPQWTHQIGNGPHKIQILESKPKADDKYTSEVLIKVCPDRFLLHTTENLILFAFMLLGCVWYLNYRRALKNEEEEKKKGEEKIDDVV